MNPRQALLLAVLGVSTFSVCSAASFNCNLPNLTPLEHEICATPRLSALDSKLGALYGSVRQGLPTNRRKALLTTQLEWMRHRGTCHTENCLIHSYDHRIKQLQAIKGGSTASASAQSASAPSARAGQGPKVVTATPVAGYQAANAALMQALNNTSAITSRNIGFKEFRLGMPASGSPQPGSISCEPLFSFAKKLNPQFTAANLAVLKNQYGATTGEIRKCTATTTVFYDPAKVYYLTAGTKRVIYSIQLNFPWKDHSLFVTAITNMLGVAPVTKRVSRSRAQMLALYKKRAIANCGPSKPQNWELPGCQPKRINAEILLTMMMLPKNGLITLKSVWNAPGVEVSYAGTNIKPKGDAIFVDTALFGAVRGDLDSGIAEMKSLIAADRTAKLKKKSSDF